MPEKRTTKDEPQGLVLHLRSDEQLAEGERVVLECGLGVVLAPANTQAFGRTVAAAVNKFGNRNARDLDDLRPQKRFDAMLWIAASSTFLGFYNPGTGKPEFAVELATENGGEPERLEFNSNTLENRIAILRDLPTIRTQVNDEIDRLTRDVSEVVEANSGN